MRRNGTDAEDMDNQQLEVVFGAASESDTCTRVALRPAADPDAALAALADSGLRASDFRARARVALSAGVDPAAAVVTYATLAGFAGRFLDVVDPAGTLVPLESDPALPADRIDPRPELVTVGITVDDAPAVAPDALADAADLIHSARRVRFVAGPDALGAIVTFVKIARLRRRGDQDRFPQLVTAPAADAPVVDLDLLRRAARERRRAVIDAPVVAAVPLSARLVRLQTAAAVPIEVVLTRLGSARDPDSGLWRCPRPVRHRNGDQNPSLRVVSDRVQCFVCDAERVDALRLVMDTRDLTPDEAAEWLLSSPSR